MRGGDFMKLEEELDKYIDEIRDAVVEEGKRRIIDRLIKENAERIEAYGAKLASDISQKIKEAFPL